VSRLRRGRTFNPALATVLAVLALLLLAWLFAQPTGVTPRGTPYRDLPAFRIGAAAGAAAMVG
jgi:hypothetical protein